MVVQGSWLDESVYVPSVTQPIAQILVWVKFQFPAKVADVLVMRLSLSSNGAVLDLVMHASMLECLAPDEGVASPRVQCR